VPVYNSFSEAAAGFAKAVLLSPNPLYWAACFASEKNNFPFHQLGICHQQKPFSWEEGSAV